MSAVLRSSTLGRLALALVLVGALLAVAALAARAAPAPEGTGGAPGTGFRPFSPRSVFNAPLRARAPLDPRSGRVVAQLVARTRERGGVWINRSAYSTPVYVVPRKHRTVRVRARNGDRRLQAQWDAVPLPADAQPSAGTDGHLTVFQPGTNRLWEFWRAARNRRGQWSAAYGGRIDGVSRNPGHFEDAPRGFGRDFGASASSIPLLAGLIRGDDWRAGRIDHALAFAIPRPRRGAFRSPAQRPENAGSSGSGLAPAMGMHFRLPADLDIDALDAPPQTKMLARAVQRYGMVLRDRGGAVTFFSEDPRTGGAYDAGDPHVPGFPWDRLQLLRPRSR